MERTASREGLGRDVWRVATAVIVGMIMVILDTTIIATALDTLARDLGASLSTIQWVSSGYLLSLALVIPLTGWMTERFGSKRIWMVSLGLFATGSALCGAAWSAGSLIFFRVIQGLGGGMILPVGQMLLAQSAGPKRVGRVMAMAGVPMLLAPVVGPVIGGGIVDAVSWRWIFYVNVPIAAIAMVLAIRLLGAGAGRDDAGRLDWRGLFLVSPGLVGVVFGLSEIQDQGGLGHPVAFGPIAIGLVLLGAFVLHSLRAARPLIDVRLFSSRAFSAASATTLMIGAALFGTMLLTPLYYQLARDATPLTAGLLIAPTGLGAALAMPFSGRLTDRIGGGRVAVYGTVVLAVATVPFGFVTADTSYVLLGAALFVRGIGLGFAMMPAMASAYAALSSAEVPRATAALSAIQRVGGAIGTAVLVVVLEHRLAATSGPADVAAAFADTFWWATGLSLLAVAAAGMLARTQRRRSGRANPRREGTPAPPAPAGAR